MYGNFTCKVPKTKTHDYGQELLSFRGSFVWDNFLIIVSKIRQNFRLSNKESNDGLETNAPAKNMPLILYKVYVFCS